MRIDSHQHFWKYNPKEYDWIGPNMAALRRDFLPEHLAPTAGAAGIDGAVSVQARQTLEETAWLLELARDNPFLKGVVGWVPLISPSVERELECFAAEQKFKGVRHVLQGEADERYMLREDFNAGIRALKKHGLVYDILIFECHLPQTIEFVDLHPGQMFVLDHIAKPRIKEGILAPWNQNLRELARRENVCCKLSGMVTEADWRGWNDEQLAPYLDAALAAFGPRRLMFGSDWPVCLAASEYARWTQTAQSYVARLSDDEQAAIFGGTASEVYGL